jgi:hypothetical protein
LGVDSLLGIEDKVDMRDPYPLAYHITFGTYGTRLHGDERGTVDRSMNHPGDPVIGAEPDWQRMEFNSVSTVGSSVRDIVC